MRVVLTFSEFVWVVAVVVCVIIELCRAAIGWLKGEKNDKTNRS